MSGAQFVNGGSFMGRTLAGVVAFGLVLAVAAQARADDQADIKAVVDKAIKSMGGEAQLAKLKAATFKGKGNFQEGGQEITFAYDGALQGTDKYRMEMDATINGMNMKIVMVLNGDKGWGKHMDQVEDLPAEVRTIMTDALYAIRLPHVLPSLKDPAFTVSHLGEMKVGDRQAVGLHVVRKERRDVNIFFDKETGQPLKTEVRLTDPQNKEIALESHYSDYKDFSGLKHFAKITFKADGKEFVTELTEIQPQEKIDDSTFLKP
jgi:outer membrane lipoprotein-sorting protein